MVTPRRSEPLAGEMPSSEQIERAEARVRQEGFVPLVKLAGKALLPAALERLLDALSARGLERLAAGVRVPALEQLRALVARGAPLPVAALKGRLAKVSKVEADAAVSVLLERGEARIAIWKKQEVLVGEHATVPEESGGSLLDEAEASVRSSGALSWAELRRLSRPALSDRGASYVSEQLSRRGLEALPSSRGVRLPLDRQILAALEGGARLPLAGLGGRMKGLAPASKKVAATAVAAAVKALVDRGEARVVVRGSIEVVVGGAEAVLSDAELAAVERASERLATALGVLRRSKASSASFLRDDLAALVQPLCVPAPPDAGRSAPAPARLVAGARATPWPELLEAMNRLADRGFGLVSIPALVRALGGPLALEAVHRALREGQASGAVELRPETSPGLLTPEDRTYCLPGPQQSLLSYAVLAAERRLP